MKRKRNSEQNKNFFFKILKIEKRKRIVFKISYIDNSFLNILKNEKRNENSILQLERDPGTKIVTDKNYNHDTDPNHANDDQCSFFTVP